MEGVFDTLVDAARLERIRKEISHGIGVDRSAVEAQAPAARIAIWGKLMHATDSAGNTRRETKRILQGE